MAPPRKINQCQALAIKILYDKRRPHPYTRRGQIHYFFYIHSVAAEYFDCNRSTVYRAVEAVEGCEKDILKNPQSKNEVGRWVKELRKFYLEKYPDPRPHEDIIKDKMPIEFWAALFELTDEGVHRGDLLDKIAKKCCFHINDVLFILRRYKRKDSLGEPKREKMFPKQEFASLDKDKVNRWKVKIFKMIGCYDYAEILEERLGLSGHPEPGKKQSDRITLDDVLPACKN